MDTWSLPKARPISCNDCPAFQRLHMSLLCIVESFTRRCCVINTTFSEKIYIRWCCIDRLSWQDLSGLGPVYREAVTIPRILSVEAGWRREPDQASRRDGETTGR